MHNTNIRVVLYDMLQMLEETTSQTGKVNKMIHKIDKFIKKANICHTYTTMEILFKTKHLPCIC